jgi:hypothetical protein
MARNLRSRASTLSSPRGRSAYDLTLLTGDPEILELADPPCRVEDLRS